MPALDDMRLFKNVVDAGGLSSAGRLLGVPKSTIARRIADLEEKLGLKLFHRGGRQFTLTNFGADCYEHCKKIASEADKILELAERARQSPTGFLHVICPPVLGAFLVETLASEFAATAPDVRLHLEESIGVFDPRNAQADLIVFPSFTTLPDSSVVARKIFTAPYILVTHPSVLKGEQPPSEPQELKRMNCLGMGSRSADWVWTLSRGTETASVRFTPRFTTTLPTALLQATLQGLGVAALPVALCAEHIRAGRLVRVLDGWEPQPITFFAVYPSNRTLTMAARQFLELLTTRLPDLLKA